MTTETCTGPASGVLPLSVGTSSNMRIPIYGTSNLAIEFRPPSNFQGTSTTTLFIQSPDGRQNLRLDFGYNKRSQAVDYHWNQRGVAQQFGVTNHQTITQGGRLAYNTARAFRMVGRPLVVVGAAVDIISIVRSTDPLRRTAEVAGAWGGAAAGCRAGGMLGARVGMASMNPLVVAGAGVGGCIIGAFFGYMAGERAASHVYGWTEGTRFIPGTPAGESCLSPAAMRQLEQSTQRLPRRTDTFDFGPMP